MEILKIYENDGHARAFEAKVLSCEAKDCGRFAVILDKTAFFPEGGGQAADTGSLGEAKVLDVREKDGIPIHFTDSPLEVGAYVHGEIDYAQRFRRMQNHSGEHIVSGIVNRLYGYNNVGFHMGEEDITIDFDGVLDRAQLREVERLANEAVVANRSILISYPDPDTLATLEYRSKKALEGRVRIVEIEGFDRCACCAPHLERTGEVGIIKILDFIHYKGGVRVHLLCGFDVLEDYHRRYESTKAVSELLSVPQSDVVDGVEALQSECGRLRGELGELKRRLMDFRAAEVKECEGNICIFENVEANLARYLVNACVEKCGGVCGVFSGDDEAGYKYIIAARRTGLRAAAKEINAALGGRGGGSDEMIQGSITATAERIIEYFEGFTL